MPVHTMVVSEEHLRRKGVMGMSLLAYALHPKSEDLSEKLQ